jgi:ribosomal protein L37AE/L43A
MELLHKPSMRHCVRCRAYIIAPEWSEYVSGGCVRNVWSCDACGYQFEDAVYFSALPAQPEESNRSSAIGVWAA